MWYQRLVSWIRSLFTPSIPVNGQPSPRHDATPTLPMTAPLRDPFRPLDQIAPPPLLPTVDFPLRREPPTTVPLARLTHPSQPLTGMPASGDGMSSLHMLWDAIEPSQPSQPSQSQRPSLPSQPLSASFVPDDTIWLESAAESDDLPPDGEDNESELVEPGSELYRRLMVLRRLVRQRIYNEGFPADATPEQYQRYGGENDFDSPFDAE